MGSVVATVGIRRSIDSALSGKVERQSPLWITSALVSPVGRIAPRIRRSRTPIAAIEFDHVVSGRSSPTVLFRFVRHLPSDRFGSSRQLVRRAGVPQP